MASAKHKANPVKKGRLIVIDGTNHDKERKAMNQEPEMKELKRMTQTGELDPERTIDHLEREGAK